MNREEKWKQRRAVPAFAIRKTKSLLYYEKPVADLNFQPLVFYFILKVDWKFLTRLKCKVVIRSVIKIHGSF